MERSPCVLRHIGGEIAVLAGSRGDMNGSGGEGGRGKSDFRQPLSLCAASWHDPPGIRKLLTVNQLGGSAMGTGKRGLLAAAVTVVCAATMLAAPGTAVAAPTPTPSARP